MCVFSTNNKFIEIGCEKSATSDSISAVLMTLQQLFQSVDVPFLLLKQVCIYHALCSVTSFKQYCSLFTVIYRPTAIL